MMLYIRMLFMMFLGLFTSRIVLEALGENDYGVYNVVGGVVAMFSIISGALSTAVSRFITYEMGKGQEAQQGKVYSASVTVMLLLSLIVIILAEPAGLWFIENKMTIAPERVTAAKWVLQFSLLAFVINLMSVPQMATITAHEKMSAYAYIGILDGILRFSVALLLMHSSSDRLVLYALLMSVTVMIIRAAYGIYCHRHFDECRYRPSKDYRLFKEIFSFAGWSFIGTASGVLRDQGGNILVNIFAGPAMNAARAVAVQLNSAIQSFVTNFMTAVNPQITKSYASGEHEYMFSLMRKASRMSYYLLFIIALPVIFNAEYVLSLWLKDVPGSSASFVRLFLVFTLSESISLPLITSMQATGRIRNYQLVVGGLQLMNLPVSYLFLRAGFQPEVTVAVAIGISQICLVARLFMLRGMIGLSISEFLRRVYLNVLSVTAAAVVFPLLFSMYFADSPATFVCSVILCLISACVAIYLVGCSRDEKKALYSFIKNRIS